MRRYSFSFRCLQLYRLGYMDREISRRLKVNNWHVWKWRHKAGLPHNMRGQSLARMAKARYRKLVRTCGVGLPEIGRLAHKLHAVYLGWPQAKRKRDAQILSVLETGPKTNPEIAAALGVKPIQQSTSLWATLKRLVREKLIRMVRAGFGRGGGRGLRAIYSLAPGVKRHSDKSRRDDATTATVGCTGERD